MSRFEKVGFHRQDNRGSHCSFRFLRNRSPFHVSLNHFPFVSKFSIRKPTNLSSYKLVERKVQSILPMSILQNIVRSAPFKTRSVSRRYLNPFGRYSVSKFACVVRNARQTVRHVGLSARRRDLYFFLEICLSLTTVT